MNEFMMVVTSVLAMTTGQGPKIESDLFLDGKMFATREECEARIPATLELYPQIAEYIGDTGTDPFGHTWELVPGKTTIVCRAVSKIDWTAGQEI
jgi:hypothetical protein